MNKLILLKYHINKFIDNRRERRYNKLMFDRTKLVEKFINKQFKLIGAKKTFNELKYSDINKYTITEKDEKVLYKWTIKQITKLYPNATNKFINSMYSQLHIAYGFRVIK